VKQFTCIQRGSQPWLSQAYRRSIRLPHRCYTSATLIGYVISNQLRISWQ